MVMNVCSRPQDDDLFPCRVSPDVPRQSLSQSGCGRVELGQLLILVSFASCDKRREDEGSRGDAERNRHRKRGQKVGGVGRREAGQSFEVEHERRGQVRLVGGEQGEAVDGRRQDSSVDLDRDVGDNLAVGDVLSAGVRARQGSQKLERHKSRQHLNAQGRDGRRGADVVESGNEIDLDAGFVSVEPMLCGTRDAVFIMMHGQGRTYRRAMREQIERSEVVAIKVAEPAQCELESVRRRTCQQTHALGGNLWITTHMRHPAKVATSLQVSKLLEMPASSPRLHSLKKL
ncbi:hypothetical protein CH063_15413 [Colletotrichum higginsianum]|uniref:Uncharacterized protein n=1 Tax=Colletotrichum higginsianum (strain IMI 349063) TaxID=759273 RepID=H1W2Q1_COLHI|nr:hypothetical protein CH063_15413 [Colletotrichum higginsianum]